MQATSYDVVLYPNKPVYAAHPDRLAVLGKLYGLQPAPIDQCRVLEIGCGDGGHLFGLAFNYPQSEFVGVDLASSPIRTGQAIATRLALGNLQLRVADILELGPELGQFDYIVAHGIYSWIPAEVRAHLLRAYAQLLSPQGLGYVSYNTRPGFHLRRVVREMLRFHSGASGDPALRIARARDLVGTVLELDTGGRGLDRMKREFELLSAAPDSRLFHDDMADENYAPYFHEFVADAQRSGLRYVSEVPYASIHWQRLPGAPGEFLRRLGEDRVRREQYLDFFVARRFRQTVLCKNDVAPRDEPSAAPLRDLYLSVPSTLVESLEKRLTAQAPGADDAQDMAKRCLRYLSQHSPQAVGFDELSRALNPSPPAAVSGAAESARLLATLWELYCGGAIELHTRPLPCVATPGTHPRVSTLARVELELERALTGQEHRPIQLNHAFARQLVPLLDGTRDRGLLAAELLSRARAVKRPDNQPIEDHAEALAFVTERLNAELTHLARVGLLVQ